MPFSGQLSRISTRRRAGSVVLVVVLLRGGPHDGQTVEGGGETVVAGACLYERSGERVSRGGRELLVFVHRVDCCEPHRRGAEDRCE